MHLTRIRSAKKMGFTASAMYPKRAVTLPTLRFLRQKSSFMIASLSLVAFITGNMMGEHGWYAFWKSVWGKYDDSLIVYTGTVSPVAMVPDYAQWMRYGGDPHSHTYRQVPASALQTLPVYRESEQRLDYEHAPVGDIYSVGNMGAYDTGAENHGSHPGVDIRMPEGTPIRSIANGIVTRVDVDAGGFGQFIVVRHPNVPDPDNPSRTTTLHSSYAHLSSQLVREGDIVKKGQQIALSGKTGFVTGPHLHFQIDRDSAPWHPYWPFSWQEARDAGMTFVQAIDNGLHQERLREHTIHPMLYVQANYDAVNPTTVVQNPVRQQSSSSVRLSLEDRVAQRRAERMANRVVRTTTVAYVERVPSTPSVPAQQTMSFSSSSSSSSSSVSSVPEITPIQAAPAPEQHAAAPVVANSNPVASVRIDHDGRFEGREWERVRIRLIDANGNDASGDQLTGEIHLLTAFGEAEFKPAILRASDFDDGEAVVQMLPRGRRTVVISVYPFKVLSSPMKYVGR